MAGYTENIVREIPIVLHDGTTLRKKKDNAECKKRYSEIIIEVNGDEYESNNFRTRPRFCEIFNYFLNNVSKVYSLVPFMMIEMAPKLPYLMCQLLETHVNILRTEEDQLSQLLMVMSGLKF